MMVECHARDVELILQTAAIPTGIQWNPPSRPANRLGGPGDWNALVNRFPPHNQRVTTRSTTRFTVLSSRATVAENAGSLIDCRLKDTFVARLNSPRSHSDNTPSGYRASHAGMTCRFSMDPSTWRCFFASVFPCALFGGNDLTLIGMNGNWGVSGVIEEPAFL